MKFKNLTIRPLKQSDIAKADKFRDFVNELIDDKTAFITAGSKKTTAQEREWLESSEGGFSPTLCFSKRCYKFD